MDVSLGELRELVMDREAWSAVIHGVGQRVGHDWATELNWTELSPNLMFAKTLRVIFLNCWMWEVLNFGSAL